MGNCEKSKYLPKLSGGPSELELEIDSFVEANSIDFGIQKEGIRLYLINVIVSGKDPNRYLDTLLRGNPLQVMYLNALQSYRGIDASSTSQELVSSF